MLSINSADVGLVCFGGAHVSSSAGRGVEVAALCTDRTVVCHLATAS